MTSTEGVVGPRRRSTQKSRDPLKSVRCRRPLVVVIADSIPHDLEDVLVEYNHFVW